MLTTNRFLKRTIAACLIVLTTATVPLRASEPASAPESGEQDEMAYRNCGAPSYCYDNCGDPVEDEYYEDELAYCDPCAASCGLSCGVTICSVVAAVVAVVIVSAIIVSTSEERSTQHAHLLL